MGIKEVQYYLSKIKDASRIEFIENYIGQNTKVRYTYLCGCSVVTSLKSVCAFKDFDICTKCRPRTTLESYKEKISFNFELLEPYHGGKTLCRVHKPCGCSLDFKLQRGSYIDITKCNCNNTRVNHFLDKLPEDIAATIADKFVNGDSNVDFSYRCGCVYTKPLNYIVQIKDFDTCPKCKRVATVNKLLEGLKYPGALEFLTIEGYNSKVRYVNPCGHVSVGILGEFVRRKQFQHCQACFPGSTKKNAKNYLEDLGLKADVLKENGRYSVVGIECLGCGKYSEVQLHSLLVTKGLSCKKCKPWNEHSYEDMKNALSDFVDVSFFSDANGKYSGSRNTIIHGTCLKCGAEIEKDFFSLRQYYKYYGVAQCLSCAPKNITQQNIYNFVRLYYSNAKYDDRSTISKELDIYCPDNSFAIEYNGLLWHSDKYKDDKNYHYKKTKECLDKGITLLHIWSDRYLAKPDIYKSIIKVKLGCIDKRVFARQTEVQKLTKNQIKDFFGNNHLDGHVGCITGWGLFYQGKLVQAVSVRKVNAQNKKYNGYLEVARSATLIDHLVVGGESKLLGVVERYARENNFIGILNYVSCDFGGQPKNKWKFIYQGLTDLSYFYTDGNSRVSRQKLQKRAPGQSEKDLAQEMGLLRVCGTPNLIYTLDFGDG